MISYSVRVNISESRMLSVTMKMFAVQKNVNVVNREPSKQTREMMSQGLSLP